MKTFQLANSLNASIFEADFSINKKNYNQIAENTFLKEHREDAMIGGTIFDYTQTNYDLSLSLSM